MPWIAHPLHKLIVLGALLLGTGLTASTLNAAPANKRAAKAAAKRAEAEAKAKLEEERGSGHPSNHSANYKKVRTASMINKRKRRRPTEVDLRGDLERARDRELVTHYQRLAELAVIAELGRSEDEPGLVDRTDAVRRNELERYRLAMARLRDIVLRQRMSGPQ